MSRFGALAVGIGVFLWRRHVEAAVGVAILVFLAVELGGNAFT